MNVDCSTILARFDALGIDYEYYDHPAVFTVEEAKIHCGHIPGGHCKNLFLRDKKKHPWLLVLENDTQVQLRQLARAAGVGNWSFASPERLMETLGVIPGAVTPLALINDQEQRVNVIIEQRLLDYPLLTFHPLINTATVTLSPADLLRFIHACGHQPRTLAVSSD